MEKIPFSPPDLTQAEIDEVVDTLRSGWITTGPKTKRFEREIAAYCGVEQSVCLSSATAGLELTLRLWGVGPGDEVITSAYTYTATAAAVLHTGASLVLVDTAEDSFEMDPGALAAAVTARTKAIIPVDVGGVLCGYDRLLALAEEKRPLFRPRNDLQSALGRVLILSDGAHSFGAQRRGQRSGSFADFTVFSFHAVKNLTTAEGGAVVWKPAPWLDSRWVYRRFMLMSLHGQTRDALDKTAAGAWEYDVTAPFYKCNMTDLSASLGLAQLRRYPELLEKRRQLTGLYNSLLSGRGLELLPHFREGECSSCHLYMTRLPGKTAAQRSAVLDRLSAEGVAANVHYKPLPLLTAYRNLGFSPADFPNACARYANELTLPLHSLLTPRQVQTVCACLCSALEALQS